jgi:D-alanyl-D-alanine carboxypeptidase
MPTGRRRLMFAIMTVLALSAMVAPAPAQPIDRQPLQRLVDRLVSTGAPGALVLIEDDAGSWIGIAGVADRETQRLVAHDDVWRIASVTKIFTATLIAQLEGEGRLKLDDPAATHLPAGVIRGSAITVRQLLNHTSGIADYLKHPDEPLQVSAASLQKQLVGPRDAAARIKQAYRLPQASPSAKEHDYSNTNYILLELIVETLTGKSYAEAVRERIIAPLRLDATGFPDKDGRIPRSHLHGYTPADGPKGIFTDRGRLVDVTDHTVLGNADGSLYASARDLAILIDGLWSASVLPKPGLRLLTRAMVQDHDGLYRYGLGVMEIPTSCGRKVIGHDGRDLGIYTKVFADQARRRKMVMVVNTSLDNAERLEKAIADLQDAVFCP